jgi:hypothetical protein
MKIKGKIYTQTFSKGKPMKPYGRHVYRKNPRESQKKHIYNLSTNKKTNNKIHKEIKKYTVWVGGTEITDFFVTYSIAKELLKQYNALGYTDVIIQEGR